ncbi:type VI secretion protein ImpA [Paraburkholderia acidicola]|uniref:Type VI secretion protein ImpA n=1 Tax=Paraburkholderia acidicola TaxID=1912599 RepID=A0A2A4EPB8_9BURK|nr:type VI secretion system protein TssA [Paraburkholderia acidicola]PCE21959.1 type VI secretion protein ImpA [Paraburkholderia acidicola]
MLTDLNALLAPINESSPCGDDMLFSSDFDAIQNARRFEDATLDQGEWITDVKEADWSFVVERSTDLLQTKTKDLRLAVWLTEGWAIEEGVAGLTQGYALLTGLCERFWEQVHPLPEGDDTEYRLGNVGWLVGRSVELLRAMPLTSGTRYSTIDWEMATHVAQAVKRDPENADDIARGKPSIEQIDAAKRITPGTFYLSLLADLRAFEAAVLDLEQELNRRAGDAAPSFRQIKEAQEAVYRLVERFAREVGVDLNAAPKITHPSDIPERSEPSFKTPTLPEGNMSTPSAHPHTATPAVPQAGIQTRAQAVDQLRAVAKFFRATEPHSPVAYLADKAAEWAGMPLDQWLSTVVKDDASLSHIREMLGVKQADAGGS